jgi:hypothetical protein
MYSSSGRTVRLNRLAGFDLKIKPNNGLIKTPTIGSGNVSGSHPLSNHPKRPRDPAQLAKLIVDIATGEAQDSDKGPMSALGRAGGLLGGRARAEKLSKERRAEIAKQAAAARWHKDDG